MIDAIKSIGQIEQARLDAQVAGDFEALNRLLSDSLVFVHPTGKVDTKASYLAQLRIRNPYVSIHRAEQQIVTLGNMAMVTGENRTVALRDPPERNVTQRTRVICVWAREGEDWRVIGYQATFIP